MHRALLAPRRWIRTLRRVAPVTDMKSQLEQYPPATRQLILNQMNRPAPNLDTQSERPKSSRKGTHPNQTPPTDPPRPRIAEEMDGEEFQARLIAAYLQSSDDLDTTFWRSVRSLARAATRSRNAAHLSLFGTLFEAAKSISEPALRTKMLYETGRYIYRMRQVRLDLVNEVEFFDALVANGRSSLAVALWDSRAKRAECKFNPYWVTMGILFHLDAGRLTTANRIAESKSEGVSTRSGVALLSAWAYLVSKGHTHWNAPYWLHYWTRAIEYTDHPPEDAKHVFEGLLVLLRTRQWDLAVDVIPKLLPLLDELEEFALPLILSALRKSLTATSKVEIDFSTLFEMLLTNRSLLSTNQTPSDEPIYSVVSKELKAALGASYAVSLARMGQAEDAIGLVEELNAQRATPDVAYQRALVHDLAGHVTRSQLWDLLPNHNTVTKGILTGPYSREDQRSAWDALVAENGLGSIPDFVAIEAMRSKGLLTGPELVELTVASSSSRKWTQLWYLLASRKVSDVDAKNLLKTMVSLSQPLTAQQLVYITQALEIGQLHDLLTSDDMPSEAVFNPILASLFGKLIRQKIKGFKVAPRKPRFNEEIVDAAPSVTWQELARRIF